MERFIVGIDWSNGKDCTGFTLTCHKCGAILGTGHTIPGEKQITFPMPKICYKCGQPFKNCTVIK